MEADLKGIVGVTILVGLVFLSLATLAFINYNFKEAIPITTNTTTLNYIIDVNTPQTLTYEPTDTATLTTPNQTWLNFNGNFINISHNGSLIFNNASSYTFIAWLNTTNHSRKVVFSQGKTSTNGIEFVVGANDLNSGGFGLVNTKTGLITRFNGTVLNTKNNIICTYNGILREIKCYRNGVQMPIVASDFDYVNLTNSYYNNSYIGFKMGSTTTSFNGSIYSFRLLDYILEPLEVKSVYENEYTLNINYSLNYELIPISTYTTFRFNDNILYASNFSYTLKTVDNGDTWERIMVNNFGVDSVFKSSNGNLIVSTTKTGNLSVSVGNDTNFTQISVMVNRNQTGQGSGSVLPWGITETNDGSILIGEYCITTGVNCAIGTNQSYIHKSTDGGLTWNIVYNGSAAGFGGRHMHIVKTDPYTGYVYATQGDLSPYSRLLRSIDNGDTWVSIQNNTDSQYISLVFTENCRIFGTDNPSGNKIVRTCDDVNFENLYTLPNEADGYIWTMQKDPLTGYILAGTSNRLSSLYSTLLISPNEGLNWYPTFSKNLSSDNKGFTGISGFSSEGFAFLYDSNTTLSYRIKFNNPTSYRNPLIYYKLNENNGTTAYDSSGNSNNGIISGATWQTDGQTRTLNDGYSIVGTTFTLTDSELAYSNLNLSYLYESETVVAREVLDAANLELVNSTPLAGLILTISLIAVVISIILGTFLIKMRGL
jgi:hypothetical protein